MSVKEKFELEYLFKTSLKMIENVVTTPNGLDEWFCDDVNVSGNIFSFIWDVSTEDAKQLQKKSGFHVRYKWLTDEEEGNDVYFEFQYTIDPMTKVLVLKVIDFAEPEELVNSKQLWDSQIQDLKRYLGA